MVSANKRLLGVTQNVESVAAAFSGLRAMYDQIETLSNKPKGKVAAAMKRSLRDAMEPTAREYVKIVENKIHNEAMVAGRNYANDSLLRHLYAGGHPDNLGDEKNALFSVNYKSLAASKGWGFEPYISTRVDNDSSYSAITGSDRSLEFRNGKLDWDEPYEPWRERAASVYSGITTSGSRPDEWYIRGAYPSPAGSTKKVPKKVVSSPQFQTNYAQYAEYFRKWWEEELAVTGFEMVDAYDQSSNNALVKAFSELVKEANARNMSKGLSRANVSAKRSSTDYGTKGFSSQLYDLEDERVAVKMSRVLYAELEKQLEINVGNISDIPDKPAPPVQEETYVPTGSMGDFMGGYDAIFEDRVSSGDYDEEGY